MTVKGRSSTLCEWALGVSVEEYCDSVQRRRRRQSSGRQRISVEISTDDESEEDTVKITYPRTGDKRTSGQSTNIKKVRFRGDTPKSALKTAEFDAESPGDSEPDPECKCRGCKIGRRRLRRAGKDTKEEAVDADTSDSEEEPKPKKADKKKHKEEKSGKKKKKVIDSSSENEGQDNGTETTEAESEGEDEAPPSPKKKKEQKKNENKNSAKRFGKTTSAVVETNNVGPSKKRVDNDDTTKKEKLKSKKPEKLRPEAALSPNLRRPNLIMPIRAEVLQVEHAIEGVEDPRPNAFHDTQHGVVRVYHGPAYGNPYGLLYPARDPSKTILPLGMPHPLQNPYFHGFANPANPGDNHFKGQSPWGAIPFTYMPGSAPVMAPVDQSQMPQMPSHWAPISPVKAVSLEASPKMSGAKQGDTTSTASKDKEKGWDINVAPEGKKSSSSVKSEKTKPLNSNVAPTSPINISLTVNPNTPWAEITSSLSKKTSPNKDGSQAGRKSGSSNGSKKSWGSKKSNTSWQPLPSGQHQDLTWGQSGINSEWPQTSGSTSGWGQNGDGNNDTWATNDGSGSKSGGGSNRNWKAGSNDQNNTWTTYGNGQNKDTWGSSSKNAQGPSSGGDNWTTTNDNNWGDVSNNNDNNQTMADGGWGNSNNTGNDVWANSGGDYSNWTTASNHSKNSKKSSKSQNGGGSNRSASGQQPAAKWDNQSNNVGFSGRVVSNGSNASQKSRKSQVPPSNSGWDNNAGPSTNSPVGNASNNSNGSKKSPKNRSKNGDQWNNTAGDSSASIPDNNAGPTTNSPNASQTSKKSDKENKTAGEGAIWGPASTGDGWNPTGTEMSKGSNSSKSMPGAWDSGLPWGDTNMAISTNGAADTW